MKTKTTLPLIFEMLDMDKDYQKIRVILQAKPLARDFFRFHVKMCGNVFEWKFEVDCPELLDLI